MKQFTISCVLFLIFVNGNIAEAEPGKDTDKYDASSSTSTPGLIWIDAETEQILFTVDNITAFDWENQVFVLDMDAALDFLAWMVPHKYLYRSLAVKDNEGIIYTGQWVNLISSTILFGPTYQSMGANTYFCICAGYPSFDEQNDTDTRFAERLYEGLERAGVLKTLTVVREVEGVTFLEPIEIYFHQVIDIIYLGWYDCDEDLKIRVEYYVNTFRISEEARAHIFFAGSSTILPQIDEIALEIKLTGNTGQFRSDVCIQGISPNVIDEGIYICRFEPWTALPGSIPVRPGTGYISLSILFRKGVEDDYETIRRLDLPERNFSISGPIPTNFE